MSTVTTKWILELGDKVTGGLGRMNSAVTSTSTRFTKLQNQISKAVSDIPVIGKAFDIVKNPIVGVTALVGGTVTALSMATKAATDYKNQFLELQNLNLDKTEQQINGLNNLVLKTAFSAGISSKESAKAFFDIQSATGKYGTEARGMIKNIADFSHATKASLDDVVNNVGKATGLFNLNDKNINSFLVSQAKTVQMGITTFDQLNQVQADYLGGAKAAGQSYDTANKVFALMTKSTKSVGEAATMTKTAFQGMIDPKVQDAMAGYGIKIFDAQGNMRNLTDITKDLVPMFAKMSDKDFSKFMGAVGGPEGLRTYLNQIKSNGGEVLNLFKGFDETKFDIGKALKNAKGDVNVLKEIVSNRLNVVLVALGQKILPIVARGLSWFADKLQSVFGWFERNGKIIKDVVDGISNAFKILWSVLKYPIILIGVLTGVIMVLSGAIAVLNFVMALNPVLLIVIAFVALVTILTVAWRNSEKFRGIVMGVWQTIKGFGLALKEYVIESFKKLISGISGVGQAIWKLFKGDFKGAFETGKQAVQDLVAVSPVGLTARAGEKFIEAGKQAGTNWNIGYNKGVNAVSKKDKSNGILDKLTKGGGDNFSIDDLLGGDGNKNTNTSSALPKADNKGLSMVGAGTGGNKNITMNLTFNNHFSDAKGSVEDYANEIVGMINDKLKDALNSI